MFGWLERKKEKKVESWKPIQVDRPMNTDDLIDQLISWNKDQSSEPELEKWYKYGYKNDLPYQSVKQNRDGE